MHRLRSGIIGLDSMLGGGIPTGRTIMISGHCGSGKTILASQYINQGFRANEPGVYVTFEQGRKKLFEDSLGLGIDFGLMEKRNKVKVIGGSVGTISRFKFRTNANANDMIDEIQEVVREIGAKRAVIDSINLFAMLFPEETDKRKAVAMLIAMLEEEGCTTLLTCEVPENSENLSWYGFEDFVVDGVIFLHRQKCSGEYQRGISIIKMRGTNHTNSIKALEIKKTGLVIYDQEPEFIRLGN